MSALHTPGPWRVGGTNFLGTGVLPPGFEMRTEGGPIITAWAGCIGEDESRANASLIAASPTMLEALDHYADQLCEGWCEQSPDCAHFDDCAGCLARRTAWKARGGAA